MPIQIVLWNQNGMLNSLSHCILGVQERHYSLLHKGNLQCLSENIIKFTMLEWEHIQQLSLKHCKFD